MRQIYEKIINNIATANILKFAVTLQLMTVEIV
jgi:hypothetical protein